MKYMIFLWLGAMSFAQIPSYYSTIDFTSSSTSIKSQLATLITNTHSNVTSYAQAWDILRITDEDPDNDNNVLLIYGYDDTDAQVNNDRSRDKDDNGGSNGEWNREHVYPKGLGTPSFDNSGPGADPHMLRACDVSTNNSRGSLAFGYGSGNAGNIGGAWYPGEEWRGDAARIVMYMYLRYGDQCQPNNAASGSSNSYHPDMPDIFLTWNEMDPVSDFEIDRNDYLETLLGNRNPFIDNPYLATLIWGGPEAENTWNLSNEDIQINLNRITLTPNPASESIAISVPVKEVYIFTMDGKLIKKSKQSEVMISDLPSAVYWIEITTLEGEKKSLKFIKN